PPPTRAHRPETRPAPQTDCAHSEHSPPQPRIVIGVERTGAASSRSPRPQTRPAPPPTPPATEQPARNNQANRQFERPARRQVRVAWPCPVGSRRVVRQTFL